MKAKNSKTAMRRLVTISPNLRAWLSLKNDNENSSSSSSVYPAGVYRVRFEEAWKAAGIERSSHEGSGGWVVRTANTSRHRSCALSMAAQLMWRSLLCHHLVNRVAAEDVQDRVEGLVRRGNGYVGPKRSSRLKNSQRASAG